MPDTAVVDAPVSAPAAPAPSSPAPSSPPPLAAPESFSPSADNFSIADELDKALDAPLTPQQKASVDEQVAQAERRSGKPQPAAEATPEPPAEPEPAQEPEREPAQAAPVTEPQPTGADELPQGVRVETRRDGVKQYVAEEPVWNAMQNSHKAILAAEEVLGEPLSTERLSEMHEATVDMQSLESALLSPDAESQFALLRFLDEKGKAAREAGEVGHDPVQHLAAYMPQYLAQANPQAYTIQANTYLRNTLDNIYRATAGKTDPDSQSQFAAAQWIDKMAFQDYKKPEQIQARTADPVQAQIAQFQRERADFEQRKQTEARQAWNNDLSANTKAVKTEVAGIASEMLKPLEKAYKDAGMSRALEGHKSDLVAMVNDAIEKDANFKRIESNLLKQAMVTNSQRRSELLDQIAERYKSKAKIVLDPYRNPEVRALLNQRAKAEVADSQAKLQRAQAGASQRQPSGGGAAPDRPVLPAPQTKPGFMSSQEIHDAIMDL